MQDGTQQERNNVFKSWWEQVKDMYSWNVEICDIVTLSIVMGVGGVIVSLAFI